MTAKRRYRAVVGLNYPPNNKPPAVRAEPGDVVDDLPPKAIPGLLEVGAIELYVEPPLSADGAADGAPDAESAPDDDTAAPPELVAGEPQADTSEPTDTGTTEEG